MADSTQMLTKYGFLLILVYPLALTSAIAIDAAVGELRFVDLLLYDSRRRLLTTVLQDWGQAAFCILPLTLIGFALIRSFPRGGALFLLASSLGVLVATLLLSRVPLMLGLVLVFSLAVPLLVRPSPA